MKQGWVVCFLISIGIAIAAYSRMQAPHRFSNEECRLCHVDADQNAALVKPVLSSICVSCHLDSKQKLSHPVDILPEMSMPADMPLVEGKLGCITCHFVHPFSIHFKKFSYFLLRRPGKGAAFCIACHGINEKGHIVFENVHMGSYHVTDRNTSLDEYTLQCIECHDSKLNPGTTIGAGIWQHFNASAFNHPVGVSYADVAGKKPKKYNAAATLPKEIRLYDRKIGCGTCHNAYSKKKYILVMDNRRSRLCLSCHIK